MQQFSEVMRLLFFVQISANDPLCLVDSLSVLTDDVMRIEVPCY